MTASYIGTHLAVYRCTLLETAGLASPGRHEAARIRNVDLLGKDTASILHLRPLRLLAPPDLGRMSAGRHKPGSGGQAWTEGGRGGGALPATSRPAKKGPPVGTLFSSLSASNRANGLSASSRANGHSTAGGMRAASCILGSTVRVGIITHDPPHPAVVCADQSERQRQY